MRRIIKFIILAAALALPGAALAAGANSMTSVTLSKGNNFTGTYYAAGGNVTVDGNVNGDVLCAGQTVVINGAVNGDVICGAQNITINGPVSGSVRIAGQSVSINGTVGRNVTVIAQSLSLGSSADVRGDVVVAGQSISVGGQVSGDLNSAAQSLTLQAPVKGNVNVRVQDLSLENGATVAGNLTYTGNKTYQFSKSQVNGNVVHNQLPAPPSARDTAALWIGSTIYWVLAALVGMLLVIWLLPRFVRSLTETMLQRPGASAGWGAIGILAGPLALFVLAITVVGIPIAVIIGGLWLLTLITSGAVAGVALGRIILGSKPSDVRHLALAALVGVPITEIGLHLPWLGTLIGIAAAVWVLGAAILSINRVRKTT